MVFFPHAYSWIGNKVKNELFENTCRNNTSRINFLNQASDPDSLLYLPCEIDC